MYIVAEPEHTQERVHKCWPLLQFLVWYAVDLDSLWKYRRTHHGLETLQVFTEHADLNDMMLDDVQPARFEIKVKE